MNELWYEKQISSSIWLAGLLNLHRFVICSNATENCLAPVQIQPQQRRTYYWHAKWKSLFFFWTGIIMTIIIIKTVIYWKGSFEFLEIIHLNLRWTFWVIAIYLFANRLLQRKSVILLHASNVFFSPTEDVFYYHSGAAVSPQWL